MSTQGVCVSETNLNFRYSVLVRLLVTYHVCNVSKVKLFSLKLMPMLAQNLLDLAGVWRVAHVPYANYLKVFVL